MAAPIAPILVSLAADTVTVEPYISTDAWGKRTFGDPVDYPTRVLGRNRIIYDQDGKERLSGATVVFFGEYNLSVYDRYTLPLRFALSRVGTPEEILASRQPECLAVDRETDENGAHHTTVYFSISRLRGY